MTCVIVDASLDDNDNNNKFNNNNINGKTVGYHLDSIGSSQVDMLYIVGNISPNATRRHTLRRYFFSLTAVIGRKHQFFSFLFAIMHRLWLRHVYFQCVVISNVYLVPVTIKQSVYRKNISFLYALTIKYAGAKKTVKQAYCLKCVIAGSSVNDVVGWRWLRNFVAPTDRYGIVEFNVPLDTV